MHITSWGKIILSGRLGGESSILSTGKQVWNVLSVSNGWKSAGSKDDTIPMIKILFLPAVTCDAVCITQELSNTKTQKNDTDNKILIITVIAASCLLTREMIRSLCTENSLLPSWNSISNDTLTPENGKEAKGVYAEQDKALHRTKQGVLTSHISVCVSWTYKSHTWEHHHSTNA